MPDSNGESVMSKLDVKLENGNTEERKPSERLKADDSPFWETPKMEDVSEQVMAQPYIRFT